MTTGPTLEARVDALQGLLLPTRHSPRRDGYGLPPIEQAAPRPAASQVRRRVRELARGAGLIDVSKRIQARFDRSGGSVASIDFWLKNNDDGPFIVYGFSKVAAANIASAGTYTAVVKVAGREITEGPLNPEVAFSDSKTSELNDNGDLPAPIVLRRGEHLTVDILCASGTVLADAAWEIRGAVLRHPNRSRPGIVADNVAEQLIAEGELFVLQQLIDSTTPQGERPFIATRPTLWHSLYVDGLSTLASFTGFNAELGGEKLFEKGVSAFAAGVDDALFVNGDWAMGQKEQLNIGFDAVVVGAGSVTALWHGRRFGFEAGTEG